MDEENGWNIGKTIADVADSWFAYRIAALQPAVHWAPGQGNGTAYGVGADGRVYTRGTTASAPAVAGVSGSLLLILALALGGLLLYRAVK